MKRQEILAIEEEVIQSMNNNGARESIAGFYQRTRSMGRQYPSTLLLNRIRYYIRMGYCDLTTEELETLYDKKMYYKRNGDENENKNNTTKSKNR
tara:strand:+ start:250 stop:534 length:285 start_codon:yes stop_codon:yes gene_type:complete